MLHLLIFIPLAAALEILFLRAPGRKTALVAGTTQGALSVLTLLGYDRSQGGFQYLSQTMLVPEWKLSYLLAADGLSVVMLLLTGLVTLAAVWMSGPVEKRAGLYYACVLFISAGCAGAFASQDLFFFYAYHELALIPTFLLIGIWGSGERFTAAWKITIYLALGSFILLLGLIDLMQALPADLRTFNMIDLQKLAKQDVIAAAAQGRPFLLLLIGFGTLVSLFPFHSWAPSAYASAPTPAAMLHAGVLKKFGLYGLLRLAVPLLPAGIQEWTWLLLWMLLANIIYIGLVTIAQKKLDLMLGYSSVMHMGYIFLGIASLNIIGVSGAALLMFAHGLSIAALFAVAGILRERNLTLSFESLGGVAKAMPIASLLFGFAAFASIGLPGFANFASEIMVFFGAFRQGTAAVQLSPMQINFSPMQVATIFALWGVVISAIYMLRAYRAVFMGEPGETVGGWTDLVSAQRWPVILLVAARLVAGFAPQYFLSYLTPTLQAVLR
jgi:NADH-quinone oxidoreductase subunit M